MKAVCEINGCREKARPFKVKSLEPNKLPDEAPIKTGVVRSYCLDHAVAINKRFELDRT